MNLHQIPELGFNEIKTSTYLLTRIKTYWCKISCYKTGICAFFDFKKSSSIAFRGEEDGLSIKEKNDIFFKSKNNMHACGHDGHMAMLLKLMDTVSKFKTYKYNILFVFQPSEEIYGGSIYMNEFLKQYNIKAFIALHVFPYLKKGLIYSSYDSIFSSSVEVDIVSKGKANHVFAYKKKDDALYNLLKVKNKIEKETKKNNMFFHVGYLKSGTLRNISPSYAKLKASLRGREYLLNEYVKELTKYNSDNIEIKTSLVYKEVRNTYKYMNKLFLALNVNLISKPYLLADDFSFYDDSYQKLYFLLGTESKYFLHQDHFLLDDNDLINGYNFLRKIIVFFSEDN